MVFFLQKWLKVSYSSLIVHWKWKNWKCKNYCRLYCRVENYLVNATIIDEGGKGVWQKWGTKKHCKQMKAEESWEGCYEWKGKRKIQKKGKMTSINENVTHQIWISVVRGIQK